MRSALLRLRAAQCTVLMPGFHSAFSIYLWLHSPDLTVHAVRQKVPVWMFAVSGNETFSIQALAWHLQDLG